MANTPNFNHYFEGGWMRHFRIYTKDGCPHCVNAKALLKSYGFEYSEIVYDPYNNENIILSIMGDYNWRSFPMIFEMVKSEDSNVEFVGGFTQLKDYLDDEL